MTKESAPPPPPDPPDERGAHEDARTVPSQELLKGRTEILIRHGTEIYRLRVTRAGKLILHK